MDKLLGLLLILVLAYNAQSRHTSHIIGGHNVVKRHIDNGYHGNDISYDGNTFKFEGAENILKSDAEMMIDELNRKDTKLEENILQYERLRTKSFTNYTNLCESETVIRKPGKTVWDHTGTPYINKQEFQFETCKNTDGSCQLVQNTRPGYRTRCMQKQMLRKLVVYSNTQRVATTTILARIPSCCYCAVIEG